MAVVVIKDIEKESTAPKIPARPVRITIATSVPFDAAIHTVQRGKAMVRDEMIRRFGQADIKQRISL